LPEDYAQRSFDVFQDEPVEVVWKFTAKAGPDAREFLFQPTQVMESQPDGSLIAQFRAGGLLEMALARARAFLIWRPPRSSPTRRIAMWSKFHLYWTGMNGSGNTGRNRRAYSNLDAGQQSGAVGAAAVPGVRSAGRTARDPRNN
jgi:hypothetical protein